MDLLVEKEKAAQPGQLETLCEMGFSRALAEEVLAAHGNDAQAALDWLAPVQAGR